jgi:predicted glycosyltransferase
MSDAPSPKEFREHADMLRDAADGLVTLAECHQDLADVLEEDDMTPQELQERLDSALDEQLTDTEKDAFEELGL